MAEYPEISLQDYLVKEEGAEYRSEYYDGKMLAMGGGTLIHDRISNNIRQCAL